MPADVPVGPTAPCARTVRPTGWLARENQRPGAVDWTVPVVRPQGVLGYTDEPSAVCGDVVRVHLAGPAGTVRLLAYRLGWYRGDGARLVYESAPVRVVPRTVTRPRRLPFTVLPSWPVSLSIPIDTGWPPGVYLLVPQPAAGPAGQAIPLIVRDDAGREPLLIKLSVFTWGAYNSFGGYSLYHGPSFAADRQEGLDQRSREVTLRRPLAGDGYEQMVGYSLPLVQFAERVGPDVAYTTDLDVDREPSLLLRHAAVVSDGHSEYWTGRMLDAVTGARNAGVNVAFLGANDVYWRARLAAAAHGDVRLVVYKTLTDDPVVARSPMDATVRWLQPPLNRDPSSLVGQTTTAILVRGSYVVLRDPTWLMAGLRPGAVLRDAVGNEVDAQVVGRPYPPSEETIAAAVLGGLHAEHLRIATMNYYSAPSGAGVFAAGTTYWVCDLNGSCPQFTTPSSTLAAVDMITTRLLRTFAQPRAGRTDPSVPSPPPMADGLLRLYPATPIGYYAVDERSDRPGSVSDLAPGRR